MSSSIRISDETKRKLEAVKRDDETFDELLARLVVDRTSEDVQEWIGGGGEGLAAHMKDKRDELNESFEKRNERVE